MSEKAIKKELEWALIDLEFNEFQNSVNNETQQKHQEFLDWCSEVDSKFQKDSQVEEQFRSIAEDMNRNYMDSCTQLLSSLGFGMM